MHKLMSLSKPSAQSALQLHGRELEPGLRLSVFISNPERKKGRTDQDANEREIHVGGLHRSTTASDLRKLFKDVCTGTSSLDTMLIGF